MGRKLFKSRTFSFGSFGSCASSSSVASSTGYVKIVNSAEDSPECSSLPRVIHLRSCSTSSSKRFRPSPKQHQKLQDQEQCPSVSRLHHATCVVAKKLKGACTKVLNAAFFTELFASNQLLVHLSAAPVANAHSKRKQLYPTVGFTQRSQ